MKISFFIFKFVEKFFHAIRKIIDYVLTWIKFFCLCKEFHDFKTRGIPYIKSSSSNSIRIGKNFRINNGMAGNQIGFGKTPCILQAIGGNITIGNNVGMSQTTIIALADISIGDNVLIGGGVKIYSTDFHSLNYKNRRDPSEDRTYRKSSPIHIGNDVFIGAGSIILKGVSIGNRSIIGAGSVVTKNIPPDEIWAGNPAKYVRTITERTEIL